MTEKVALLTGQLGFGILRTTCEVLDTSDPDNKIFRFKEGCVWRPDYTKGRPWKPDVRRARHVHLYAHWSEFDVGPDEGSYRVCARLETPPGYLAVLEGTTKPEVIEHLPPDISDEALRCELAIMAALESEPRVSQRELRRKTSSHRFGSMWDVCLRRLAEVGDITIETDKSIANQPRTWVSLSAHDSTDCITVSNANDDSSAVDD
jgi:hypothetical protein